MSNTADRAEQMREACAKVCRARAARWYELAEKSHLDEGCCRLAGAKCIEDAAAIRALPLPPPSRVEEAQRKVLDAAKALREADTAYTDLYSSVKDDEDARDEARGRLDRLHAVRLNKRFDLDAYTDELLAAERGEGGGV